MTPQQIQRQERAKALAQFAVTLMDLPEPMHGMAFTNPPADLLKLALDFYDELPDVRAQVLAELFNRR